MQADAVEERLDPGIENVGRNEAHRSGEPGGQAIVDAQHTQEVDDHMIVTRIRELVRSFVRRVGEILGPEAGASAASVGRNAKQRDGDRSDPEGSKHTRQKQKDRSDDNDERSKDTKRRRGVSSQSWRGFPRHDDSMDHEQIRTQGVGWWHGGN